MLEKVKNAFKVKDIRSKLIFTLLMLLVIRLGSELPVPGVDRNYFANWFAQQTGDAFGFMDAFTGGSFLNMSVFALNITPYITSSIIIELLTIAIPKLEELQRDGNEGRKKISQYTRYLTVILAMIESIAMAIGFGNQGLFVTKNVFYIIVCVLTLTAGSAFLMWVGERINDKGVGNGISIVLVINILSGIPQELGVMWTTFTSGKSIAATIVIAILIIAAILAIVMFVVWLNGAQRRIPVQYAGKIVGRRSVGGQSSSIPLKILTASVIPVIFASSLMSIPSMIAQFAGNVNYSTFGGKILMFLSSNYWFNPNVSWVYSLGCLVYLILIFVFAYFYTSITFNPIEVSDNLKKQGGFIPGIRPGRPTSDYLNSVLNNVVFIGACGLSIVALIPIIVAGVFSVGRISFLGTSLIIIVGVILETLQQIGGRMVEREYDSIF